MFYTRVHSFDISCGGKQGKEGKRKAGNDNIYTYIPALMFVMYFYRRLERKMGAIGVLVLVFDWEGEDFAVRDECMEEQMHYTE